jgi:hypothetical protein
MPFSLPRVRSSPHLAAAIRDGRAVLFSFFASSFAEVN